MSNFRRRLMCKKSESELPSGYTKLNYLEKDGYTQYINTGIIPQPEWTYELDFERTGDFNWLCGSENNWNEGAFNISIYFGGHNEGLRVLNFGQLFHSSYFIPKINQRVFITKAPNKFILNSNIYNIPIGTETAKYPLVLFTVNRNGEVQTTEVFYQQYRMYRFSIKSENQKLIMNLVPSLDKNGTPCMYDTVSKQPFYNQGTGEFLYG